MKCKTNNSESTNSSPNHQATETPKHRNAEARAAWQQVLDLLSRTGARPLVDSVFPFDQLPKAFARLAQGPMGKALLEVKQ
jgi:NADPH:quinone reductase-like Zn-dependent oxidoreductase